MIKKTFAAVFVLTAVAACNSPSGSSGSRQPEGYARISNNSYKVVQLFKLEDCTVYRFYDKGASRYVTICPNRSASTTSVIEEDDDTTIDNTIQSVR